MQTRWSVAPWRAVALCGLIVLAAAARAETEAPVSVTAAFIDPAYSEQALFSPDGKVLALPNSGMLWEATSGLPLRRLDYPAFFTAAMFTPDSATLVSGHKDGVIKLWDVASGAVVATLPPKNPPDSEDDSKRITTLSIDRKGELLASGDHAGGVTVWMLSTRRPIVSVERQPVLAARLSADGSRLIVVSRETPGEPETVTDYDARTGAERASFRLPAKHLFPEHSYLGDDVAVVVAATECARGETVLFGLRERAAVASIHRPATCELPERPGYSDSPLNFADKIFASPQSSRILVAPQDGSDLVLFDTAARKLERTIRWPGQTAQPQVIGLSQDVQAVATVQSGAVRIRALESGAAIKDLRGFGPAARNVIAHGPHILVQRRAREGDDGDATLDFDLRTADALTPVSVRLSPGGAFMVHDFAPAPRLALAGNNKGEVLLLPLDARAEPRKLAVNRLREVWDAKLAPDGRLALVVGEFGESEDSAKPGAVAIDTADGRIRQTFPSRDDNDDVVTSAFTPDGARFAVGRHNGKAELWDAKTLKRVALLPAAKEDVDVRTLAFSPDGRFLAGAGAFDDAVFVWNVASRKVTRVFDLGTTLASYRYATALAMSRDGKTLVAGLGQRHTSSGDLGSERGTVVVWDAVTGKRRLTLRGQRGAIAALTFSADERFIVAGSLDGTIRYWDRGRGRPMATAMSDGSGGWLVLTESGLYAGSDGSDAAVAVVRGTRAVAATPARGELLKPRLVEDLLKGDAAGRYRNAARRLDLPAVAKSAAP